MQLSEINKTISGYGLKLLARIKYGFSTGYDKYDFLSVLDEKRTILKLKTEKTLSKKINY